MVSALFNLGYEDQDKTLCFRAGNTSQHTSGHFIKYFNHIVVLCKRAAFYFFLQGQGLLAADRPFLNKNRLWYGETFHKVP